MKYIESEILDEQMGIYYVSHAEPSIQARCTAAAVHLEQCRRKRTYCALQLQLTAESSMNI